MGLTARLRVGALPDATVTGTISRIAPQAKEKDGARLFDVEIELDPMEAQQLPGSSLVAGIIEVAATPLRAREIEWRLYAEQPTLRLDDLFVISYG